MVHPQSRVLTSAGILPVQALYGPQADVGPVNAYIVHYAPGVVSTSPNIRDIRVLGLVPEEVQTVLAAEGSSSLVGISLPGPVGGLAYAPLLEVICVDLPLVWYTLSCASGESLVLTAEQQVWTPSGWTAVQDLPSPAVVCLYPQSLGALPSFRAASVAVTVRKEAAALSSSAYEGEGYSLRVAGLRSYVAEGIVVRGGVPAL